MRKLIRDKILSLLPDILDNADFAASQNITDAAFTINNCLNAISSIYQSIFASNSPAIAEYEQCITEINTSFKELSEAISNTKPTDAILQALLQSFVKLQDLLFNEKTYLEIVFMPYNASMWDCMESVWEAAVNDPNCECHVVPIPYYRVDYSKLELTEFIYEIDRFPEYINAEHYKSYNLEANQPDIIYIHNIYDDYNKVTYVAPEYHTAKLKEHTGMLVYIPYYVEQKPNKASFYDLPGLRNVDKVIVQSKAARKEYLKFCPSEKVLAMGSPKFDKALKMDKNKPAMPDEWKEIARNRKIVFYNTHLSGVVSGSHYFFDKLSYVFDIFSKRDDVCLLWRPHPLSEATIGSMKAEHLEEYKKIIKYYNDNKIGIYDDSSDLHRAIALSDSYYGDNSSLVAIFAFLGKPILIQTYYEYARRRPQLDINTPFHYLNAYFFDLFIEGDTAWFSAASFNGLFRIDMLTGVATFLGRFINELYNALDLHSKTYKYKNKLIFTPYYTKNIAVYDILAKHFSYYEIDVPNAGEGNYYFHHAEQYKEFIFIFPAMADTKYLIAFNSETCQVTYLKDWCENNIFKERYSYCSVKFKAWSTVRLGFKLYLPCAEMSAIFCFDLEKSIGNFIEIESPNTGFSSMCYDGKLFWLTPSFREEKIISWDEKKQTIKVHEIPIFDNRYILHEELFLLSFYCNGLIHFAPFSEPLFYLTIDIKTHTVTNMSNKIKTIRPLFFYFVKFLNENYVALNENLDIIYLPESDSKKDFYLTHKNSFYQDFYSQYKSPQKLNSYMLQSEAIFSLPYLLNYILNLEAIDAIHQYFLPLCANYNSGAKIHTRICTEINL